MIIPLVLSPLAIIAAMLRNSRLNPWRFKYGCPK